MPTEPTTSDSPLRDVEERLQASDPTSATYAEALVERAALRLLEGDTAGAAADWVDARAAFLALGQAAEAARCELSLARQRRLEAQPEAALEALGRAEALRAALAPDQDDAQIALERAELWAAADPARAEGAFVEAASRWAALGEEAQALQALQAASALAQARGDHEGALAYHIGPAAQICARALAADLWEIAAQSRLVQAAAREAQWRLSEAIALAQDALQLAERAAPGPILAQALLTNASFLAQMGRRDDARDLATRARAVALALADPHSYLTAAVLLSALAEAEGDKVEAYEALLRAHVGLKSLLGEALGGELLSPAIDALAGRWGLATFEAVIEAHSQRYARRAPPTQRD